MVSEPTTALASAEMPTGTGVITCPHAGVPIPLPRGGNAMRARPLSGRVRILPPLGLSGRVETGI